MECSPKRADRAQGQGPACRTDRPRLQASSRCGPKLARVRGSRPRSANTRCSNRRRVGCRSHSPAGPRRSLPRAVRTNLRFSKTAWVAHTLHSFSKLASLFPARKVRSFRWRLLTRPAPLHRIRRTRRTVFQRFWLPWPLKQHPARPKTPRASRSREFPQQQRSTPTTLGACRLEGGHRQTPDADRLQEFMPAKHERGAPPGRNHQKPGTLSLTEMIQLRRGSRST